MIVWLASYPKSGNTWVRVFLTNYLSAESAPADINDLQGGPIASARPVFDELVGVEASDLTSAEIAYYRPAVYRLLARESGNPLVMKVHDAFRGRTHTPMFPVEATTAVVYILRNPLDVAVSLAHHHGVSIDQAVSRLCDGFALAPCGDELRQQLEQVLLSWSGHVQSWVDESNLPVHVVRYEDLTRDPGPAFQSIVEAAGLEADGVRIARAIKFSRFEELLGQERDKGFKERSPRAASFFRKGRIGDWRTALTPAHVRQVVAEHGETMRRFGYLTDEGEPVY